MFAAVALSILFVLLLGDIDQKLGRIAKAEKPEEEILIPDAEAYTQWLMTRDNLQREVRHCRERYDDLTAQGAQPMNTLEQLPTPTRTAGETASMLSAVERDVIRWQTQLDQAIGALRSDPVELEARCGELEEKLERRTAEFDALTLALDVLESANAALRERFSPTLNREAADIFSDLTGGKYHALTLSRDFSAMVGEDSVHSSLYLSAGTMDQLYLSVRLALCKLTVPEAPILLDDALCAFDDARTELALKTLAKLSDQRQILLLSCHSREADWAQTHQIPVICL